METDDQSLTDCTDNSRNHSAPDLNRYLERLLTTRNFRELSRSFLERILCNACDQPGDEKEILSKVKTQIEESTNGFRVGDISYRELISTLGDDPVADLPIEDRQLYAADFLRRHESSKERLPFVRRFYTEIFDRLPPIRSILDLGCGLNPVAVLFMPVEKSIHYAAVEVAADLTEFLNDFFHFIEIEGVAFQANLLDGVPDFDADLTLVLKTIPLLENLEPGAGRKLFNQIKSPYAVVSFPTENKPGKTSDELENQFVELFAENGWEAEKVLFPNETVYILKRS